MIRTRFVNLRIPATGNETKPSELVVEEGRFVEVVPAGSETAASEEQWVNLEGALVLPAAIDGHVHFDDPGFTHREDFASGTSAAAAGGVSCVVDMPCTSIPPVVTADDLSQKLRSISAKAHVDFMLWGGVSGNAMEHPDWKEHLSDLVDGGVAAIKVYMLSAMKSFRHLNLQQIEEVTTEAARSGIPVGVHAESREMVRQLEHEIRGHGAVKILDYAATRPSEVEITAVASLRELCRKTGAQVHIVHLASGDAVSIVAQAKEAGLPMTAETCPHFLEFTQDDLVRLGSVLKTAPVVKTATDREMLWQGLANGDLDLVGTDHAPGQWPEEKSTGSIWTDYAGVPGVELMVPYLYSEGVCTGRLSLERLTEVTASAPARLFGISHRKGRIEPGLDADFVVFDENESWTVHASRLHSLNRYTPLDGRQLTGRVRATYLRGRCVFQRSADGSEMLAPSGTGKWIARGVG